MTRIEQAGHVLQSDRMLETSSYSRMKEPGDLSTIGSSMASTAMDQPPPSGTTLGGVTRLGLRGYMVHLGPCAAATSLVHVRALSANLSVSQAHIVGA